MNINDLYAGDYLRKEDLEGKNPTVTIAGTEIAEFAEGDKVTLLFEGTDKKLTLNKTNALAVAEIANSFDTGDWTGVRVQLYVDPNVMYRGTRIGGIRIRKPASQNGNAKTKPVAEAANEPPPLDDDWFATQDESVVEEIPF